MKEQGPVSLQDLQAKHNKINRALAKVDTVYQTVGTSTFNRHLDLTKFDVSTLEGLESYTKVANEKVGEIKKRLEQNARPTLLSQKEQVESEIGDFDRIAVICENINGIREAVQAGRLPRTVLDNAVKAFNNLLGTRPAEVTPLPPVPASTTLEAEERMLQFPGDKKIPASDFSPNERALVEGLLCGSPEQPVSTTELKKLIYGGKFSDEEATSRFHGNLVRTKARLVERGIAVINLYPRGSEGSYYLVPLEAEVVKKTAEEKKHTLEKSIMLVSGETLYFKDILALNLPKKELKLVEEIFADNSTFGIRVNYLARALYHDNASIRKKIDRIRHLIIDANAKLSNLDCEIVNVTPRGRAEAQYILRSITKDKLAIVKEKLERQLPHIKAARETRELVVDGRRVRLNEYDWAVFEHFAQSDQQESYSDKIAEIVKEHGSKISFPAGNTIRNIRNKIEQDPINPRILVTVERHSHTSTYRLQANVEFVDKLEEVKAPVKEVPPKVEKAKLPLIRINLSTAGREIEIDGRPLKIRGKISRRVLLYLARHTARGASLRKIDKVAKKAGSKAQFSGKEGMYSLRRQIEEDPKNPKILIRNGPDRRSRYRLNANVEFYRAEVETKKDKELGKEPVTKAEKTKRQKKSRQIFDVPLPDGEVVKIQGPLMTRILEILSKASSDNPPTAKELAQEIYGQTDHVHVETVRLSIKNLNSKCLKDKSWEIEQIKPETRTGGQVNKYRLKRVDVDEEAVSTPSEEAQLVEAVQVQEIVVDKQLEDTAVQVQPFQEQVLELPYKPTGDERRTDEETKILNTVVTYLSGHTRLYFDQLQKSLSEEIQNRKHDVLGGVEFDIYTAAELKEKFLSAFDKLRQEAEIEFLRVKWSEAEKELWESVQKLIQRESFGDIEGFKRKIRSAIDRAERDFYQPGVPRIKRIKL